MTDSGSALPVHYGLRSSARASKAATSRTRSCSDETIRTGLLPTARAKLDQVAAALQSLSTDQTLLIEGHADDRGTSDFNHRLSSMRADAVRAYLVSRGVAPEKLTSLGKGEDEPVASNDSAEGRANNRRVEIVISRAKSASR